MISLLTKIFVKEQSDSEKLRQIYGMICSGAGIALNIMLFVIKFVAGSLSGAISVTADAFNNLSDSGSSLITMFGFRLAAKKPDPGHPFGHGRIEYLSGIAVSILIVLMGFELLTGSVDKIMHPEVPETGILVFSILAVSIFVKFYMFLYNRKYGKICNSAAMKATATDCLSDMISTSVVFVSMLITRFTSVNIDAYCGLAVAAFILYAGLKSAYETIGPLLGQPPEPEFVQRIEDIVLAGKNVLGVHDLIVHDYGPGRRIISLHAEVPAKGDILALHDEIDNIERDLGEKLGCIAVIHMDPVETDNENVRKLKTLCENVCKDIYSEIKLHDFRIVEGNTHTNIIFDVVVPHGFRLSDAEIKAVIEEKVKNHDKTLFTVVTVDKDFSQA
ncbi:MAG: cation transporter [Ruminococcaceae bacterium]|nr:cation transporter [Oscillospiraceae bacterium]MBR3598137.1 cation transporter [Clostridia bacterium]